MSLINVITIDGTASSGKSTLSQLLSEKIQWKWLSSGILYRGLSYIGSKEKFQKDEDYLALIKSNHWKIDLSNNTKNLFFYKNQDITAELYGDVVDELSSHFSANSIIREELIPIQRRFYDQNKGLIMEGRDSGTVIFPQAPLKIFLEASDAIRAQRRAKQRDQSNIDDILKFQKERDRRDKTRDTAPLKKPENCLIFNTESQTTLEILEKVYQEYQEIFVSSKKC